MPVSDGYHNYMHPGTPLHIDVKCTLLLAHRLSPPPPPPTHTRSVLCTIIIVRFYHPQILTLTLQIAHKGSLYHGKVSDMTFNYNSCYNMYSWYVQFGMGLSVLHTFSSSAWDLLMIDVYGFEAFCEDFLDNHPRHFISPLRISGSAIETEKGAVLAIYTLYNDYTLYNVCYF